jgi:hypothetical protein
MGHEGLYFLGAHPFLHRTLHTPQPDPELLLQQFPHGPHSAITQMIDIINSPVAMLQQEQESYYFHDIGSG